MKIVGSVLVDEDSADQSTELDQCMPVAAVASETGTLDRKHRSSDDLWIFQIRRPRPDQPCRLLRADAGERITDGGRESEATEIRPTGYGPPERAVERELDTAIDDVNSLRGVRIDGHAGAHGGFRELVMHLVAIVIFKSSVL
jgi:hypothetical protein